MPGESLRVFLVILDLTIGTGGPPVAVLSYLRLSEETALHKRSVERAIRDLLQRNMITRAEVKTRRGMQYEYRLQTDSSQWVGLAMPATFRNGAEGDHPQECGLSTGGKGSDLPQGRRTPKKDRYREAGKKTEPALEEIKEKRRKLAKLLGDDCPEIHSDPDGLAQRIIDTIGGDFAQTRGYIVQAQGKDNPEAYLTAVVPAPQWPPSDTAMAEAKSCRDPDTEATGNGPVGFRELIHGAERKLTQA